MSIMREIGRQIGHQKTAIRLPGMGRGATPGPITVDLGARRAARAAGGAPGPGPTPQARTPMSGAPRPGQAAQQGLMGILRDPRFRNAAGTVGRASKIGIPGGILANRLIAALAAQNRMEGNVNQAVGSR